MTPPPASEIVPDFVGSGPEGRRARALPGRAVTVSRSLGDSACAESLVSGDMSLTAESPSDPPLPHRRSPVGRPRYAQSCRTRSRRALRPDKRRSGRGPGGVRLGGRKSNRLYLPAAPATKQNHPRRRLASGQGRSLFAALAAGPGPGFMPASR